MSNSTPLFQRICVNASCMETATVKIPSVYGESVFYCKAHYREWFTDRMNEYLDKGVEPNIG